MHHPLPLRRLLKYAPVNLDLQVIEVQLINSDKQKLHGYFSGSRNGAFIMLHHGFKNNRSEMFEEENYRMRATVSWSRAYVLMTLMMGIKSLLVSKK